ncbi:uncharacterized protein LOC134838065 [Culicoides brevitarsis]|uniref:uncharacterized protein LOC134838065 n=1 Tax=Culicoides brevitarsis TaxID=469753 RepID=UPI00307C58EC
MSNKITFDAASNIWRGPELEKRPYGSKGVGEVVFEALLQDLKHICQISDDSGEIYTNERMLKEAISVANGLRAKGIKKGDTIVILMHNHHYLLPIWVGCVFAGAVLCPIYFGDSSVKGELCELMGQVQPKMMITSHLDAIEMFQGVFKQIGIDCPIYIYENAVEGCHDFKPFVENYFSSFDSFKPETIDNPDNDLFVIVMSSSTTGKPKLINSTHSQLLYQTVVPFSKIVIASTMQPGWHTEFVLSFIVLIKHCTKVMRAFFTIDEFLKMLEKYKVQVVYINPRNIFQMLKSETLKSVNLENLLFTGCVGQHMSAKMASELQSYLPNGVITSIYGISDIGGAITEPSDLKGHVHQLVGKVRRGLEIVVLDEKDTKLGPNEVGEIGIRVPLCPFPGYYKNDKLTKESVTSDGFYRSGDLGYVDVDGNVFLVERKKYNIPYRGKLINQGDVERIILENVQGVAGVCVVDVESDEHGMLVYIAIILEKGVEMKESDVIETVMKHHPFEFETKVFFFDELPMTISAKYKKHLVREMIMKKMAQQ